MDEEKLANELKSYQELAKKDKKIDVAALMMQALQKQQTNNLPDKQKRWGYLVSLALPPFGLIFAFKFYFSGKDDGEQAAWICGILTAISVLLGVLFVKVLVSASGLSPGNLPKPSDIQQFVQ